MSIKAEAAAAASAQPSSTEPGVSPYEPGAAAASPAGSAAVKQEEWSLESSSLSLDQLEQQFRESVHSERQAATGYLLSQGLLLLRLLARKGIDQPRDYGEIYRQPTIAAVKRSTTPLHAALSHHIDSVRLFVQCATCTNLRTLKWRRVKPHGAAPSYADCGRQEHSRCSSRFETPRF